MLNVLIIAGRFTVVVAAVIMVAASTLYGGFIGSALLGYDYVAYRSGGMLTGGALFAALGFSLGILAAGSVFGIAAAIFDMQRSLRIMASNSRYIASDGSERPISRAEPRL